MSVNSEDLEKSCLARQASGADIMWNMVSERLFDVFQKTRQNRGEQGNGHIPYNSHSEALLTEYPVMMHDIFCLLYAQQSPEIVIDCELSKIVANMVDTARFRNLRGAAIGDPVLSAITAISVLEALRGVIARDNDFTDVNETPLFPCEDNDEERMLLDDTPITECENDIPVEEFTGNCRRLSDDRIQLGLMLQNPRMRDILNTFGRIRNVVTTLQDDDEVPGHSEDSTLDHGDDISNAEMSYLMTTPDEVIAADMASESLPVIRSVEHDGEGMGPMILLLDVSSSMNHEKQYGDDKYMRCIDWALGFCFAAVMQCRDDKRTVAVIPFDHTALEPIIFENGVVDIPTLERLLGTMARGGTCFGDAAVAANALLEKDEGFKNADIVWISDGCVECHEDTKESWRHCREWAKAHEANGTRRYALDINDRSDWWVNLSCGEAAKAYSFEATELAVNKTSRVFNAVMQSENGEAATLSIFKDLRERSAGTDWL